MIKKEILNCLYCDSKNYRKFISWYDDKISDTIHYVQCEECDLIFMNPRPIISEMHKYYLNTYYSFNKLKLLHSHNGRFFDYLKICLLRKVISLSFKKLMFFQEVIRCLLVLFFNVMAGGTGLPHQKHSGRLLDVGCGDGFFMYVIGNSSSFEVCGIEPSGEGVKIGKEFGLNIKQGDILSYLAPDNYFDVIMMKGSLEHTHYPLKVLEKSYKLLSPGGEIVCGGLPNINNLYANIFGSKLELFYDRHHTFIPEYIHIVGMFSKIGFKDIKVKFVGVHLLNQSIARLFKQKRCAFFIAYNPVFLFIGGILDLLLNVFGNGGGGLEIRAIK